MRQYRLPVLWSLFAALSCALIFAEESDSKPADLIVGKWQGEHPSVAIAPGSKGKEKIYKRKETMEFRKDGTFTVQTGDIPELKATLPEVAKGETITGTYSFVKKNEMELTAKVEGKERKIRFNVIVTAGELTVTVVGFPESPKKYTRIKQ